MKSADLFTQLKEEEIELLKENVRLKDEVSFWKPLACSALGALFGVLGAVFGFFIMTKIGVL